MLKNHLTIAFRNAWRNKSFTFIHILGLSIGISAALVIFLIVKYELGFDKFQKDGDRIYRLVMDFKFNGDAGHGSAIPGPMANAIRNELTGFDASVPIMQFQGDANVKVEVSRNNRNEVFKKQPNVVFTVNEYFDLIPFEWIAGSPTTSLSNPFTAVITESRAKLYFPGVNLADIPGRHITYDGNLDTEITGVVKDLDQVTTFKAQEFISYATIFQTSLRQNFMMDVWNDGMAYSTAWVKLSEGTDKIAFEAQLNTLFQKYNPEARKDSNNTSDVRLQPLDDVHFNSLYGGFDLRIAHMPTLYGLLAIAGFLLLLGCINFVNLSTAQASHRAKEIGIRKTIGSSRKQLVVQFLCETLVVTTFATIVSISIAPILLQLFSDFIPPGVGFDILTQPDLLLIPGALLLLVGLLAGFYPAIFLSRFRPAVVLKNQAFAGSPTRNAALRKILTVFQFTVAQFFVIVAFMIGKQIHFSLNQDLGYRKDAIVNFEIPFDTVASHVDNLANTINSIPGVQMVSAGFLPPAMEGAAFSNIKYNNGKEDIQPFVQVRWGDSKYLDVYNIDIVAGRNVREGKKVNELLINEAYAKDLGFENPADALQKELINGNGSKTPIVGIMRNFHEGSLHRPIGNIVFKTSDRSRVFHVALEPGRSEDWQRSISAMDKAYHEIYPDVDFNYSFFDDTIASFYKKEQQTAQLLNWATGLSILISLLGLLGLVIYISEARSKEIGIRKILGASVSNLVMILSREFVVLIVIAFAIAAPLSAYAISEWLMSFEYKTEMSAWVFAISGLSLLLVAIITLSAQTIRTATSNPVDSLRNE